MWMLVWRDLQYRKWRVLAVTMLMAIVITLLFLMTGLVGQFRAEPRLATNSVGSDLAWILPTGTGGPFTSAKAIPASAVASIDGAEPILMGRGFASGSGFVARAVVIVGRSFAAMDVPSLQAGNYPGVDGQVVVDASLGLEVGDTFELSGATVEVVGIAVDATVLAGLPLVFAPLSAAQLTLASAEPVVIGALASGSPDLPPGLHQMTSEEVMADTLVPLEAAISSVGLTRGLLWLITAIIIAAVIYIGVLERTRDFAVLKAVGGRNRDLAASILIQGVVMTLLATAVAAVLQMFVAPAFPLTIRIPASAWWQIPLIAVIVALLAGIGGVRKVSSTSPAEAFS